MLYIQKISSIPEFLISDFDLRNKNLADVGCGNGAVSLELAKAGAKVTGIDKKSIITKIDIRKLKLVKILEGKAEKLPFRNSSIDYLLYSASFHHVPKSKMKTALAEAKRVLKKNGKIIFIEPVAITGTYYSIARHYREEKEIQKNAYDVIKNSGKYGFMEISENFYYVIRNYAYYEAQIGFFEKNKTKRALILKKAKSTLRKIFSAKAGEIHELKIKSVIRVNVLKKSDFKLFKFQKS
ncbi:MAG: class I SAM-dependent methyltransferase [Ignavibacteria bacterium]|nr:class I SAM-dependent methyltransferase [Ignavibacteria bacterium]